MKVIVLKGVVGPGIKLVPDPDTVIDYPNDAEAQRYIEAGIFALAEEPPAAKPKRRSKKKASS